MYSLCQCVTIIAEETEGGVALVTQHSADLSCAVTVVYVPVSVGPGGIGGADSALETLRGKQRITLFGGYSVVALELLVWVLRAPLSLILLASFLEGGVVLTLLVAASVGRLLPRLR
jgi:hypothetical protein